jgi:2-polyprenyl-3-methyl-5-hydroxy-6-metoxy-1,4-benzoquinol methylase
VITIDFKKTNAAGRQRHHPFHVLDIGCGHGRHLGALMRIPETTAIGSDINHKDLLEAKKKLEYQTSVAECVGKWHLLKSTITRLPLKSNFFDLVICSEVLEHIHLHRTAVKELLRVLKVGGIIAISVPRYLPERICWWLSRHYYSSPGGHVRIYRKEALISLLKAAGAQKITLHYAHSLHSPFWWLKCLLGARAEASGFVRRYHRLLVWDMMSKPKLLAVLDRLLNPLIGKSLVVYFKKQVNR